MRRLFLKGFLGLHILLYRLSGGRVMGRMRGMDVLLLTTRGRKTGKQRTAPLLYLADGADVIVVASGGGAPQDPAWYRNLQAAAVGRVRVKADERAVRPETLAGEERERFWRQFTALSPQYADYARQTTRQIPVVRLRPTAP